MKTTSIGFMDVLYPHWAWLFVLVPCVFAVAWWGVRRRARDREKLVVLRLQARFLPRFSPNRAVARVVIAA